MKVQDEQFEKLELNTLEECLAANEKEAEQIINAIAKGGYHESMNALLSKLQKEHDYLEEEIKERQFSMILLKKSEVVGWLKRYRSVDTNTNTNQNSIKAELIHTFINKIVIDNSRMILFFNFTENGKQVNYEKMLEKLPIKRNATTDPHNEIDDMSECTLSIFLFCSKNLSYRLFQDIKRTTSDISVCRPS